MLYFYFSLFYYLFDIKVLEASCLSIMDESLFNVYGKQDPRSNKPQKKNFFVFKHC